MRGPERRIRHSPLSTNPTGGQSKCRKGVSDTRLCQQTQLVANQNVGKAYPTLAFVNKPNWWPIKMSERRIRHSPLSTIPTGGQSKCRKGVSDTRLCQQTQLVANQNVGKAYPTLAFGNQPNWWPIKMSERRLRQEFVEFSLSLLGGP